MELPPKKDGLGRPVEYPDSPIHRYWREQQRKHYYRKKKERAEKEGER